MATRRMRRTREVPTSGDEDESSGFDLYRIQGNTNAAWSTFLSNAKNEEEGVDKTVNEYNLLVLGFLNNPKMDSKAFLRQLEEFETNIPAKERSSDTIKNRNDLILNYNRALVQFASGDLEATIRICNHAVIDLIRNKIKPEEILVPVLTQIAFLLLECLLAMATGRHNGFHNDMYMYDCPHPDAVLEWLDTLEIDEQEAQFKFLFTLYKGRVDLAHLDDSGKHMDSKVRSARKELKTAMEVYQHKLRQCFGADTASVVSSANSEGNSSAHFHLSSSSAHDYQQQQQRPSSTVLQRYGQSALSLKAHLEQLKGNTKKSLILCSEAQGSTKEDGTYDAIHENNLSVVYGTNGKPHLAFHSIAKALRATHDSEMVDAPRFHNDGTVRRDKTLEILHNTALCALQAKRFVSAYECMVACISRSTIFRSRLRCWLRMAEACIGVFAELNEQRQRSSAGVTTVLNQGEPSGVIMDPSILQNVIELKTEDLVIDIGSAADIEQVKRNPLLRARFILQHIVDSSESTNSDQDVRTAAQLSLAYVCLAFKDFNQALSLAVEILESNNDGSSSPYIRRQCATARMYAAESLLNLLRAENSMKYLVGDGNDGALDRLVSDLSGVTNEDTVANEKAKLRLAKAEVAVRSSTCAAYCVLGDVETAKELANTAVALGDAADSNVERSIARRALVYALLREGQQSSALNLLMSFH